MKKLSRLIITHMDFGGENLLVSAKEEEGRICQFNIVREGEEKLLGNIYIGKVKNIRKNIHCAFIEIAPGKMCYYDLEEGEPPIFTNPKKDRVIKEGDEVVVQVSREGIKSKLPSVTGNLNFTGRYLVLTSQRKQLGFSAKLTKEEKARIRTALQKHVSGEEGIIVRTNAREASPEELTEELFRLREKYQELRHRAMSRVCYTLLEKGMSESLRIFQGVYIRDLEEIVTDDSEIYTQICGENTEGEGGKVPVRFYEDKLLPLSKLYRLEKSLEEALDRKVWLRSGGFLVIEQTEAFVSIDVNSGKFSDKKNTRETFRKINLEAAREIAFQLRLRNLSGIILIDFINMEEEEDKKELLKILQGYLRKDPIKAAVVDMTPLNIVEVTRKKVEKSLEEEIKKRKDWKR
ncbi:MAG TPA: ribonuclease E/G [Candidatus Blautia stercoripullorum]|uniref:Ribonuclease E/G n=1 Tax=Candidatus Blautia stercoripullorum TaxID=2838502 RepID=A0A9D2RAH5_9FIRM|nr:ribonuclease E/G [Candidatus Blautia stercoripullorum]